MKYQWIFLAVLALNACGIEDNGNQNSSKSDTALALVSPMRESSGGEIIACPPGQIFDGSHCVNIISSEDEENVRVIPLPIPTPAPLAVELLPGIYVTEQQAIDFEIENRWRNRLPEDALHNTSTTRSDPPPQLTPEGDVVAAEAIRYERDIRANQMLLPNLYETLTDLCLGPQLGHTFRDCTDTEIEHQDVMIRKEYANGAVTYTPVGWGSYHPEEERLFRKGPVRVTDRRTLPINELKSIEQRIADAQSDYPNENYEAFGGLSEGGWNCQEMADGIWKCIIHSQRRRE